MSFVVPPQGGHADNGAAEGGLFREDEVGQRGAAVGQCGRCVGDIVNRFSRTISFGFFSVTVGIVDAVLERA